LVFLKNMDITIKESTLDEAIRINKQIPELEEPHFTKAYCEQKCGSKEKLVLIAYLNKEPAGYLIGFDHHEDGSFYCWMVGVLLKFRRKGVLTSLMQYQDKWAKKKGYTGIRLKTRNKRREMLAYLVKYGFSFARVIKKGHETPEEYRICMEKKL